MGKNSLKLKPNDILWPALTLPGEQQESIMLFYRVSVSFCKREKRPRWRTHCSEASQVPKQQAPIGRHGTAWLANLSWSLAKFCGQLD